MHWTLGDHLGSVRDIVDSAGTMEKHVGYSAFGQKTIDSNPSLQENFGFADGFTDSESGLINHSLRWQNPATVTWMSQDPIGLWGGDSNQSRYVLNQPTGLVDPTGLDAQRPGEPTWIRPSGIHWYDWILGPGSAVTSLGVEVYDYLFVVPSKEELARPTSDYERARDKADPCWRMKEAERARQKGKDVPQTTAGDAHMEGRRSMGEIMDQAPRHFGRFGVETAGFFLPIPDEVTIFGIVMGKVLEPVMHLRTQF
jgi:RHS repeat-associated protein